MQTNNKFLHVAFFLAITFLSLSEMKGLNYDASAVYPLQPSEYTQTPLSQVIGLSLSANVENKGTQNITNVRLGIKVLKGGVVLNTLTSANTIATIVPNAANSFSIPYTPINGDGVYTFKYYPIFSQSDQNSANDTSTTTYTVSISEYSRHSGASIGGFGIGTGDGDALIGSLFTVNNTKLLNKIKVDLDNPMPGTMVKARIYATSGGLPVSPSSTPLWESDVVTINAGGAQSVNFLSSNMPMLQPGTYWFGCLELDYGLSVSRYSSNFTANRQYVYSDQMGAWETFESQPSIGNEVLGITPVFDLLCTPGASPAVAITGAASDSIIVCNGTPVILTTSASGVSEYRWYRNDTIISSQNGGNGSIVVNAGKMVSGTDIYTLKVYYTGNQCLSTPSVALRVKNYVPLATITTNGASTFCQIKPAPTTTLTANAGTGYNYVWKLAGNTVQSSGITHTPVSSGAYTVVVTDPQGCSNTSAATTITILTHPAAPSIAITGSATNTISVCSNVNVVLNPVSGAGTMAQYIWYKNSTTTPVSNQVGGTGKYTANSGFGPLTDSYNLEVMYAGNQCVSVMSAPITVVNISPVTNLNYMGSLSFCANTPQSLNVSSPIPSYSYTWKRGATIVQVGGTSYTPTVSGSHTVTIADANTGCTKASLPTVVTINALPIANAGVDKSICYGETAQIGSTAIGTNTYTWTPSTGLSNPYTAMPILTSLANGTYTLTVYDPTTTCSNTDVVVTTTLPKPPTPSLASSTASVCQGSTIILTPTSTGAASLNWYKNGVLQYNKPTTFSQVVNTPSAAPDNYTIKGKGSNGCLSSFSDYKNVWVKPAAVPVINSTLPLSGTTLTLCVPGGTSGSTTLTATSTTASPSYAWKQGANFISGATNSNYFATVTTTSNNKVFRVQATYPNGCVALSAARTLSLVTSGCAPRLGIDKEDADAVIEYQLSMSSYPNPTTGLINVSIENSESATAKLVLFNTLGQSVWEKDIQMIAGKVNEEIDMTHFATGIYSLSFLSEKANQVLKVVKE